MKKIPLLLSFIALTLTTVGQNYFTKTGHIWIFSSAPMENIEAHNHQVTSIINAETGEIVFKVLMKGFQFEKALMQEHFNEKYVESDKYPESVFKGKISNLNDVNLNEDGKYKVKVEGDLSIHGITKKITADGTLEVLGKKIVGKSLFKAAVADYGIKIPGAVKDNIAKVIDIHVDISYEPLK